METLSVRASFSAELGGGWVDVQAPVHAAVAWIKEHVADATRTYTHETEQNGAAKTAATTPPVVPASAAAATAAAAAQPPPLPLDSSQLTVHILAASGARRPANDAEALSLCARWANGPAASSPSAAASAAASAAPRPALLLHVTSSLLSADALAQVHLQLRGDSFVPSSGDGGSADDLTAGYLSSSASGAAALSAFGPASCWSVIAVPGGDRTVLLRNTLTQQFLAATAAPAAPTLASGADAAAAAAAPVSARTPASAPAPAVSVCSSVTLTQRCMWRLVSRGNEAPADGKAGSLGESLGYYIELARSGASPPLYLSACAAAAPVPAPSPATGASSVSHMTLQCVPSLRRASAFDICPRLLCGLLRERTSHALAVPPAPGFFVLLNRRLLCFAPDQAFNSLEPPAVAPIIAAAPAVAATVTAAVPASSASAGDDANPAPSLDVSAQPPTQMVHVHIPLGHEVGAPAPASDAASPTATATTTAAPLSVSVPSDSSDIDSDSGSGRGSSGSRNGSSSSIPLHLARRIYPLQLLQSLVVEANASAAHGQILRLSFPQLQRKSPGALVCAGGARALRDSPPVELLLHVQLSAARALSPPLSPSPSPTATAAAAAAAAAATGSPAPASAPAADVDPSAWRWRSALESELRRSPAVPASACVALDSLVPSDSLAVAAAPTPAAAAAVADTSPPIAASAAVASSVDAAALAELRSDHALLAASHAALHRRSQRSESLLLLLAAECASSSTQDDDGLRVGGLSPAHCRALSSIERSFASLGRSSHLAQVALKQTQIEFLVQQLRDAQDRCANLQEELRMQAVDKASQQPQQQQQPQDASPQ